jgi:hypothetical protein
MRKGTLAVLFVCWGLLSAAAWKLCQPIVYDWTIEALAGRTGSSRAQLIASVAGGALPFVAVAAVILLMVLLVRPTRHHNVAQRPAEPQDARTRSAMQNTACRATRTATKRLYIRPAKTLVASGARFGVVLLADGADTEIFFKKLDDRGTLMAQVPDNRARFKCFVDYKGLKFERVKHALSASRFTVMTPRADRSFRAWFLLPGWNIARRVALSRDVALWPDREDMSQRPR